MCHVWYTTLSNINLTTRVKLKAKASIRITTNETASISSINKITNKVKDEVLGLLYLLVRKSSYTTNMEIIRDGFRLLHYKCFLVKSSEFYPIIIIKWFIFIFPIWQDKTRRRIPPPNALYLEFGRKMEIKVTWQ